jgi:uncharacterized membrane protein
MSVQWTVARAVGDGVIKHRLAFVRTAKGGGGTPRREFEAFWETVIGGLLVLGAIVLVLGNRQQIREIYIFAAVLVLQSLPFLSALAIVALERSRFNDFAYWRRLEARLAELVLGRAVASNAPTPAEKRSEPVP